ncbi:hypothetical protein ONS96_005587 [Cadophora gregata f. sp. sojae]|nr:hypothetical protein ONS96_005587 [Cadophora gregata f. sp. sojae]
MRPVANSPSSSSERSGPDYRLAPLGRETVDQSDQNQPAKSQGRQKRIEKWQTLDFAAAAPPAARAQGPGRPIGMNGLSRGVSSLATGGLRTLPAQEPSVPLTLFTNFGKLPAEIRLKIWGLALNTERVLEVIWDGADEDPKHARHYHYRISPRSGARPALMDVCHESRAEAERFYLFVDFTTTIQNADQDFKKCGPIMTYYNPEWDIILFGEYSCIWSIVRVIQDQRRANVDIHRIAIMSSGQLLRCHDWNHDGPIYGPDQTEIDYGYAIAGGCTVMQALHGIHKDVAWTEMESGVKGLKEVFFVVPTHLIPGIAGKVDESIGFRPARGSGLTSGQVKVKSNLQKEVDLIEAGGVLPYCSVDDSMNNWSGYNKPEFKFVTFTPKSRIGGKIFDSMIVSSDGLPRINGRDWKFIKDVERKSGCHMEIPKRDYPTQPSREIGLYGTRAAIDKAIKLIQGELERLSGTNWTKPTYVKIAPGYSTKLGLEFYHPQAAATKY